MSQSDTSCPANFQAETVRIIKYVDMANQKLVDKVYGFMDHLMNKQTDQCEVLLSGMPSGLELTDDQVLGKTFSIMGLKYHELFITKTRSCKPRNPRSVKEHIRAIVFQCSSSIVGDGLAAQTHKLARIKNKDLFDTGGESQLSLSLLWPKNVYHLLRETKSLSRHHQYPIPIVQNFTVFMRKSPQSDLIPYFIKKT
ncbi:hypothetical protein TKK_0014591 [Trichogramma kaykai]